MRSLSVSKIHLKYLPGVIDILVVIFIEISKRLCLYYSSVTSLSGILKYPERDGVPSVTIVKESPK
jgi:hypothetical protein